MRKEGTAMKALRKLTPDATDLVLVDVPLPEVPPGHVLLKVAAAGICGTDVHIMRGEYPSSPPVTLGHEVAGEIAAVGADVSEWEPGERVVTESFYTYCGRCEYCVQGHPNLCTKRRSIGSGVDGGLAEYGEVPSTNLHRIPDHVDFVTAALCEPVACTVRGLDLARIRPGEWVALSGPGPMGLLALQIARASGARVIVLGITQDAARLEAAQRIGADHVIDVQAMGREAAREAIVQITNGGAQVVLECAGAGASASLLFDVARKRGRFAQIGLYGQPVTLNMDEVCYKELTITGTFASVPDAWPRAMELLSLGIVKSENVVSGVWPLEEWREAFARVQAKGALKIMLGSAEAFRH